MHLNASLVTALKMIDLFQILLIGGSLLAATYGVWRLALAVVLAIREFRGRR